MAKIAFRFLEVVVKDDDVASFINKMEEVLNKFAGKAYHFRYYIEEPPNTARPTQRNELKG